MSLANFKISEGLNIKGLILDNNSGMLTWDGDNIATEGYVTTAIGNISIPPAYITSVGSNLSVTDGELNVDFTGLATETYVGSQGFLVSADLSGYALTADLNGVITGYNYITSSGQYIQSVDSNFTVTANELTLNGTISVSEIDVAGSGDFTVTGNANIVLSPANGSKAYIGSVSTNNEIVTMGNVPAGYTNTDVDNHLSGTGGVTYSSGIIGLDYTTVESTLVTDGFAKTTDIPSLSGYATETYVNSQGFITNSALSGYATETYVGSQGFLVASDISGKQDTLTAGTYITITGSTIDVDTTTIATKAYVDGVAQGLDVKQSVNVATTENISSLSNSIWVPDNYQGVNLGAGSRILVKNQDTPSENGIYVIGDILEPGFTDRALSRADDANTTAELNKGAFTFVESGTSAGVGYVVTSAGTLGSDPIVWTQFSAAGEYTAGSNITISGNSIAVSDAPTFNNPTLTVGSSVGTLNIYSDSNTGPISWGLFRGVVGITASGGAYITGPITSNGTYTVTISGATGTYASLINGTHTAVVDGMYLAGPDTITFTDITDAGFLAYLSTIAYSSSARTANLLGNDVVVNVGGLLTISSTEISYLDGVTSNIQTQLDAKQDTLASTTDVSVKTVTTQNADGVSSKVVAFGNTTDTTYAMGSDVTVETLAAATKATDIFLQILDNSGNARTSKLTAVFNGGSAPIWTEYGVVDSGTTIAAIVSFDSSKHIIVNVTGSGTYAVRGTATSLL